MIIRDWLNISFCNENRYIKHIYNMMLQDMTVMREKENWAALVKRLSGYLGFNDVWMVQGVGNVILFNLVKPRLQDYLIQKWAQDLKGQS